MLTDDDLKKIDHLITNSVTGSEQRIKTEFRTELKTQLTATKNEIIEEVGNFIAETIVPQFDKHDKRFEKLESLPTIAHGLRVKS